MLILDNCKHETLPNCREMMLLSLNLKFYITVLVKLRKHINKSLKKENNRVSENVSASH